MLSALPAILRHPDGNGDQVSEKATCLLSLIKRDVSFHQKVHIGLRQDFLHFLIIRSHFHSVDFVSSLF
jgi:hypothetical protein